MKKHLRRYFLYGLTIFLPVLLTGYVIALLFNFADGFLGKLIKPIFIKIFGFYFWGLSIIIFLLLVVLIGFLATHFFGRRLYPFIEKLLLKVPFVKQIYPAIKEIASFLFNREKAHFKQVVLVEYPRKGVYSLGFLVSDTSPQICQQLKGDLCNILIPTSPSPFTGFVVMVPRDEIIFMDIKVEEAIKFIVSDGVVNPHDNRHHQNHEDSANLHKAAKSQERKER